MRRGFSRNKKEIDAQLPKDERMENLIDDFGIEIEDSMIKSDVIIDDNNLNEELLKQPLLYIKWVELAAKANKAARNAKVILKQVEGHAKFKYKQKGSTVDQVNAQVDTDAEVIAARQELNELEVTAETFNNYVRSVYQRLDTLKELCANKRKELID